MLVTLNEVLKDAQKQKYAVGLFNTVNLEMAKGVLAAAEELNSPVIIGTAEVPVSYTHLTDRPSSTYRREPSPRRSFPMSAFF